MAVLVVVLVGVVVLVLMLALASVLALVSLLAFAMTLVSVLVMSSFEKFDVVSLSPRRGGPPHRPRYRRRCDRSRTSSER